MTREEDWNEGHISVRGGRLAKIQRHHSTHLWLPGINSQSLGHGSIDRARAVEQVCDPWS